MGKKNKGRGGGGGGGGGGNANGQQSAAQNQPPQSAPPAQVQAQAPSAQTQHVGVGHGQGGRGRGQGQGQQAGQDQAQSQRPGRSQQQLPAAGRGRCRGRPQVDPQALEQQRPPPGLLPGPHGSQAPAPALGSRPTPTPTPTPTPSSAWFPAASGVQQAAPLPARQVPVSGSPASAMGGAQKSQPVGKHIALPVRANCPQQPKSGKPIPLEVNHLPLRFEPNSKIQICHYDVTIDPDKPKRFMRPVMMEMQRVCYPQCHPGFDGRKNLYSKGRLPFGDEITKEVNVVDDERHDGKPKTFKVTVKITKGNLSFQDLAKYLQTGKSTNPPQDVIQAIDVIFRSASAQHFIQVGRSFFFQPSGKDRATDLGNGLELYLGYFQSFILGRQPYLNIDVAHKGFPKEQNLLSLLQELNPRARSPEEVFENKYSQNDFEKYLRGLKVEYSIPGIEGSKRTYRVNGLRKSAVAERFEVADGRTMTVGEYFAYEKHYNLRFPRIPCLHVGPKDKQIMVPIELCKVVKNQAVQRKLDENQTSRMIKIAATSVDDRKTKIRQAMQRARLNDSPEVREFGLSVSNDFAKVGGRILPPPMLQYKPGRTVMPARGVWRGGPFRESCHLQKWICVVISNINRDAVNEFTAHIQREATKNLEMRMDAPDPPIFLDQRRIPQLNSELDQLKRKGYQLVLVVINGFNKQLYGQVKQMAEINVGILTQCVKDSTVTRRNNPATVHNIMLKINAKFNGTNQTIARDSQIQYFTNNNKVLIFGADVTHPSPDSRDIPSVAAVTASHDLEGFKYNMKIRLQPPRQEMITDLLNIVIEQLQKFKKETNSLPQHLIFYRDGVSEGQFQQVLDQELNAIRQACGTLQCCPKITFLVVQKRHHTRFFPLDRRHSEDKNGNVPAGTIVDSEITHPTEIDFYLVSHASIQGVARPTKYHVLWDDANMSENEIQLMTYNLCHLFTRCDRAVSYPAPTYYAHLAASRGRVYLEGQNIKLTDLDRESRKIQTALNFTSNSPMYFV